MSIGLEITIESAALFDVFLRVRNAHRRPDVRKVMGRAIATEVRKNFTHLDRTRANHLGGDRTHFYGDARRGVQQPELEGGDGVKVAINQVGIAQRYFGGPIVPGPGKTYLTIPIHPEAYGRRAGEFGDLLSFVPAGNGQALLVDESSDPDEAGVPFYWLTKRVDQEPDRTVLPDPELLEREALAAADDYLGLLLERAAA